MLAVIAAKTRMHSRPSRKTRTPISNVATAALVCDCVGSGAPCAARPCQTMTATTPSAAMISTVRKPFALAPVPDDVEATLEYYHGSMARAVGELLFFSGQLRLGAPWDDRNSG